MRNSMKLMTILSIPILLSHLGFASAVTPRTVLIQSGPSFVLGSNLPQTSTSFTGIGVWGAYLYRVGDLSSERKSSWIGVFLGNEFFPKSNVLSYGFFIKHVLSSESTTKFWLGYGLGLAQATVNGVSGRGLGHVSSLRAGIDFPIQDKFSLSFDQGFQWQILPAFYTDSDNGFKSITSRVGAVLKLD